mgnify:CR=1 FL=1
MSKRIDYRNLSELDSEIAGLQEVYSRVEVVNFGRGYCNVFLAY